MNSLEDSRKLREILDSDDELPDFYIDTPEPPAYKNDFRFDRLHFELFQSSDDDDETVETAPKETTLAKENKPQAVDVPNENIINTAINNKEILLSEGYLTKRDIFIIKSIEDVASTSTLLWLIDFFKCKLWTRKPKSCLVYDLTSTLDNVYTPNEILGYWE